MSLFRKDSVLENKLKRVKEELSMVNKDIRSLSDVVRNPDRDVSLPRLKSVEMRRLEGLADVPGAAAGPDESLSGSQRAGQRDEKFRDYLSAGFESTKPLRQERRVQRNKAIVMMVAALLLLFWFIYSWRAIVALFM